MKALGLVETRGIIGAIEAADVALKTAQVELINKDYSKGGLVALEFEGDVGAVKAAVEAASAAAERLGVLITSHIIPRPDDSIEKILKRKVEVSEPEMDDILKEETKKEEKTIEAVEMKHIEEEIEEMNEILKVSKNKNKKNKK